MGFFSDALDSISQGAGSIVGSLVDSLGSTGLTLGNTAFSTRQQWKYYKKQSKLDWEYYRDKYAPLNQQLQNEMFDYQTAGNLKAQGDLVGVKKNALLENGYNPILAINGGVSGSVSPGSTGSLGSPHSARGISANIVPMKLDIMKNAIEMDLAREQKMSLQANTAADVQLKKAQVERTVADTSLALQNSKRIAAETRKVNKESGKVDPEIKNIEAKTKQAIQDVQYPGYLGKEYRSLRSMYDDIFRSVFFLKEDKNSAKPVQKSNSVRPRRKKLWWELTIPEMFKKGPVYYP